MELDGATDSGHDQQATAMPHAFDFLDGKKTKCSLRASMNLVQCGQVLTVNGMARRYDAADHLPEWVQGSISVKIQNERFFCK